MSYQDEAKRRLYYKARPIRYDKRVGRSMWRVPDDGYVTPRLRQRGGATAIGFHHDFEEAPPGWSVESCDYVTPYKPSTPPWRTEYDTDGNIYYVCEGALNDRKV